MRTASSRACWREHHRRREEGGRWGRREPGSCASGSRGPSARTRCWRRCARRGSRCDRAAVAAGRPVARSTTTATPASPSTRMGAASGASAAPRAGPAGDAGAAQPRPVAPRDGPGPRSSVEIERRGRAPRSPALGDARLRGAGGVDSCRGLVPPVTRCHPCRAGLHGAARRVPAPDRRRVPGSGRARRRIRRIRCEQRAM